MIHLNKENFTKDDTLPFQLKEMIRINSLAIEQAVPEPESVEYGACRFVLDGKNIVFRVAKITPKKVGQFVTVWKRPDKTTMPFESTDSIDFIIIYVADEEKRGQFIFDKEMLIKKGIISNDDKIGKMGIRVYPPWSSPESKQGLSTQKWQLNYFYAIDDIGTLKFSNNCYK
jgi:hypothetical protein